MGKASRQKRASQKIEHEEAYGILRAFLSKDIDYVRNYLPEVEAWAKAGVYEMMADTIGDINNGIAVDLACGFGNMLTSLRRYSPKATLIGVDVNPEMLKEPKRHFPENQMWAGELLAFKGRIMHPLYMHPDEMQELLESTEKTELEAQFDPIIPVQRKALESMGVYKNPPRNLDDLRGKTTWLMDDTRSLRCLKRFLEGEKVDVVATSFTGTWSRLAYQAPFSLPKKGVRLPHEEVSKRLQRATQDSIASTYGQGAALLKPGGRLVITERFKAPDSGVSDQAHRNVILHNILDRLPKGHTRYFEEEQELRGITMTRPASGVEWINERQMNRNVDFSLTTVCSVTFTRNEVPFEVE